LPEDLFQVVHRFLRRAAAALTFISLLALAGLGLVAILSPQSGSGRLILPLSAVILLAGLGGFGWMWLWARRSGSEWAAGWLARDWILETLALFSGQVALAGLGAVVWLNVRLLTPAYLRGGPLLLWLVVASLAVFLLLIDLRRRLSAVKKWRLSLQEAALLPVIALTAGLLGLTAANLLSIDSLILRAAAVALAFDLLWLSAVLWPVSFRQAITLPRLKPLAAFIAAHPAAAALIATMTYFGLFFALFQPGYGSYDDAYMAGLASGYFGGGQPSPFIVHSNLVWGLLAQALFRFQPTVNWLTAAYFAAHFLAVWALIWTVLGSPLSKPARAFSVAVLLLFETFFLTSITFTTAAAMAAIGGLSLLLNALRSDPTAGRWKRPAAFSLAGILITAAAMIRIESLILMAAILLPAAALYPARLRWKWALAALAGIALLTVAAQSADRAILHASSAWTDFDRYNQARSGLHDTARLQNADSAAAARIGWSRNDLLMFSEWFYPDPETYSLTKLEAFNAALPDKRPGLANNLIFWGQHLLDPAMLPFVLLAMACWLAAGLFNPGRRAMLAGGLTAGLLIGFSLYLGWTMKLPFRVLLPLLAGATAALLWVRAWEPPRHTTALAGFVQRLTWVILAVAVLLAGGVIVHRSLAASALNRQRQSGYTRILAGLDGLQAAGSLPANVLIVAPGLGIPLEWADPLSINFPRQQYLTMSWLNFSPAYQLVLDRMHVKKLPDDFYRRKGVLLMTRSELVPAIQRYVQEHNGLSVEATPLYKLPDSLGDPEYDTMQLYCLQIKP
jgi:hypothetical protein